MSKSKATDSGRSAIGEFEPAPEFDGRSGNVSPGPTTTQQDAEEKEKSSFLGTTI